MAVRVKFITLLFLAVQGLVLKLIYPSGKALVKHEPSYLRKDPVIMRRLLNQGDSLWGDAAVNYSCRVQYGFTSAANVTSHCSCCVQLHFRLLALLIIVVAIHIGNHFLLAVPFDALGD